MAKLPQDYDSVMARKNEVMNKALSIDYSQSNQARWHLITKE